MPLFFLTAGFFARKRNIGNNIIKNFARLIVPYVFTSGVYIAFNMMLSFRKGCFKYTFVQYFISWISDYGFEYNEKLLSFGALWFLTAIFCSNILFNILLNIFSDDRMIIISSVVVSILGFIVSRLICLPFNADIGMYAVIFECFGYCLRKVNMISEIKKVIAIVTAAIAFMMGYYVYSYDLNTRLYNYPIISTLGAIGGSVLFLILCNKCLDKIKYLRNFLAFLFSFIVAYFMEVFLR